MSNTEILRRVSPNGESTPEMQPETTPTRVRPRVLRWTGTFPTRPGWYWIRPKEFRYNRAIIHIPKGLNPERFDDTEFSDAVIPVPIEPNVEARYETEWTALVVPKDKPIEPYVSDEAIHSPLYYFFTGGCVGTAIGVGAMFGMQWLSIHHP